MKIKFRKVTNIRSDHQSLGTAPIGIVYANTLLEVDGVIHEGATVKGDNRWWRDHNGWYYWAGETEEIAQEPIETVPSVLPVPLEPEVVLPSKPVLPPEPALPPTSAVDFVALPIPDDSNSHSSIPEGEWRSLDGHVLLDSALDSIAMAPLQIPTTTPPKSKRKRPQRGS